MAEIENIHCPICTQPIPSSWQNGLPPALAKLEQRGVLQNITEYYRVFLAHLLGPIFGLVQRGSLLSNNHVSVKIIKFYVTSTTLMCFSEDHGVLHNLLHLSCRLLHHVPLRLPCGETGLFRIQNPNLVISMQY